MGAVRDPCAIMRARRVNGGRCRSGSVAQLDHLLAGQIAVLAERMVAPKPLPSQGEGRGFESRRPLQGSARHAEVGGPDQGCSLRAPSSGACARRDFSEQILERAYAAPPRCGGTAVRW